MNIKYLLALPLPALALLSTSLSVEESINWNVIRQQGRVAGIKHEDRYTKIFSTGPLLKLDFESNGFYFHGQGAYNWVFTTPKYRAFSSGIWTSFADLQKKYRLHYQGTLGYAFDLDYEHMYLGPQIGFAYQRLKLQDNLAFAVGAPFIGARLRWFFTYRWDFELQLNYSAFGFRRENIPNDVALAVTTKIRDGFYHGPNASLNFFYELTDQWHLSFAGDVNYVLSNKKDTSQTPSTRGAYTSWFTVGGRFGLDYRF